MQPLLAVVNAEAGSSTDEATSEAIDVLESQFSVEVLSTSSPDDLKRELDERPDATTVVVIGGDGSLHAVVQVLRDLERLRTTTLGLVPLGTGNDYARGLDLPLDPAEAARVVLAGHTTDVDLVIDDDDAVVVNAAHVGIGAEAAAKAKPYKKVLGPLGYAVGALITGFTKPGAAVEVYLDGEPLPARDLVLQVAVGNGPYVGGGAELLPDADPTDGEIDVAVSYATGLFRRLSYAWHLRRGEHPKREDVVYRRCRTVEVRGERMRCTSDGELTPPKRVHAWRLEPGVLTLLTPHR